VTTLNASPALTPFSALDGIDSLALRLAPRNRRRLHPSAIQRHTPTLPSVLHQPPRPRPAPRVKQRRAARRSSTRAELSRSSSKTASQADLSGIGGIGAEAEATQRQDMTVRNTRIYPFPVMESSSVACRDRLGSRRSRGDLSGLWSQESALVRSVAGIPLSQSFWHVASGRCWL
jgi:hypothetical protein